MHLTTRGDCLFVLSDEGTLETESQWTECLRNYKMRGLVRMVGKRSNTATPRHRDGETLQFCYFVAVTAELEHRGALHGDLLLYNSKIHTIDHKKQVFLAIGIKYSSEPTALKEPKGG
jgi:hypothetical protein